jgi:hypothetical protein
LLRARRERPCRCAAEHHDELAPLHSITSSARASKVGGISRPSRLEYLWVHENSDHHGMGPSSRQKANPLPLMPPCNRLRFFRRW